MSPIDFETPGNADPFAQAENTTADGGVDSSTFAGMFKDQSRDGMPMAGPNDFKGNAPSVFTDESLLNERPRPQIVPEGQEQAEAQAPPQEPYDPRNDPKRMEYHQSRADRYRNSLQQVEPYIPIVEYLQNDPEALQYLEQRAMQRQGIQPQGMPMQPAAPVLEAPKLPEKPATYNLAEALTPGTDSFKYREALEQYQLQKLDYMEKVIQDRESRQQQQLAEFQRQQQIEKALNGVRTTLATKYQAPPDLIEEFIQYGTDPKNVALENLWQLFMIRKQSTAPQAQGQKVQQDRNARQRIPVPVPGAGSPIPAQTRDPNALFSKSMEKWDQSLMTRRNQRRNQG